MGTVRTITTTLLGPIVTLLACIAFANAASCGGGMAVGINTGWGQTTADDMKGVFKWARLDTTRGGTELPSTYNKYGIKVILCFPGYSTKGVRSLNAHSWALSALNYFKSQCGGSKAKCPAIEVLNEPYGNWFWGPNANSQANADAYAVLLKTVWTTFHKKYGSKSPLILGAWDTTWNSWHNKKKINVNRYVDGVVVHPYGGTGNRAASARGNLALVSQAHKATRKPLYITEVGWPTAVGQPATGDSLQWTEQQQADNVYNFIKWARSTRFVAAVTIFGYRDYGTNMYYGLESVSGTKKPGWTALQEVSRFARCSVCSSHVQAAKRAPSTKCKK